MAIHVDEAALNDLKHALETAGEGYKKNLAKLTNLIDQITNEDIQGDPAQDLLTKFQAKEETFKNLANTIDEAEGYMGMQTTKFTNMIGDLKSGMQ